jgi:hypothetical protein
MSGMYVLPVKEHLTLELFADNVVSTSSSQK